MKPIEASNKTKKKLFCSNLQGRIEKQTTKFKLGQLVRTADIKRNFSKGDSTKYSFNFYKTTEITHDTIPSYRIKYLPERYNQISLLPIKLSLEQNNQIKKKLNLIQ